MFWQKKWIEVGILVIIMFSSFSGCFFNTSIENITTNQSQQSDIKENKTKDILELTLWHAVKTGTMYSGNVKEDIVKEAVAQRTGVKVVKVIDNGTMTETQKFNLLFAAGDFPDILRISMGSQCLPLVEKLESTDYIYEFSDNDLQQLTPNILAAIAPSAWEIWRRPNGMHAALLNRAFGASPIYEKRYPEWAKIYANGNWNGDNLFLVRDDILKAVFPDAMTAKDLEEKLALEEKLSLADFKVKGLDTWDDLVKFLYQASTMAKDGESAINLMVGNGPLFCYLMRGFLGGSLYINFDPITLEGCTVPVHKKDQFLSLFQTLNKMYNDGVISKDFGIIKSEKEQENSENGKYLIIGGNAMGYSAINSNMAELNLPYRFRLVNISYETGDEVCKGYYRTEPARVTEGFYINKKKVSEEDLPRVLGYLDFFASDEGNKMVVWGPESAGLWEETENGRKWRSKEFEDVLLGGIPVGQGKDFDYYGLQDLRRETWRQEFWWPHNQKPPVYYPTVKPSGNLSMVMALYQAIADDKIGFYQDDHAAWNGTTATNTVFWNAWQDMLDQLAKVVVSLDEVEFAKQMDIFYDIYYNKAEYNKYFEEQSRLMREYFIKNKDIIKFHPKADLNKFK